MIDVQNCIHAVTAKQYSVIFKTDASALHSQPPTAPIQWPAQKNPINHTATGSNVAIPNFQIQIVPKLLKYPKRST